MGQEAGGRRGAPAPLVHIATGQERVEYRRSGGLGWSIDTMRRSGETGRVAG